MKGGGVGGEESMGRVGRVVGRVRRVVGRAERVVGRAERVRRVQRVQNGKGGERRLGYKCTYL